MYLTKKLPQQFSSDLGSLIIRSTYPSSMIHSNSPRLFFLGSVLDAPKPPVFPGHPRSKGTGTMFGVLLTCFISVADAADARQLQWTGDSNDKVVPQCKAGGHGTVISGTYINWWDGWQKKNWDIFFEAKKEGNIPYGRKAQNAVSCWVYGDCTSSGLWIKISHRFMEHPPSIDDFHICSL